MEKLKNIFKQKNKKVENLVVFLIILVITLIIINKIIKEDDKPKQDDYFNAELATENLQNIDSSDLEKKLENILSTIDGVGKVSVLITYSESNTIVPMYNESVSKSVTEETDTSGGVRTIQSEDNEKSVVTGSDSNPVTRQNNKSCCRRSHCYSARSK